MPDPNTNPDQKLETKDDGGKVKDLPSPQMYELVVDGEKRSVTIDEMRDLAQKASGAEKRFQAASELKKEAEDGLRLKGLIDRVSDGSHQPTDAEIKELSGMLGLNPDEFAAYLQGEVEEASGKGGKAAAKQVAIDKKALVDALGFDPAEAKATLDYSRQRHIDDARKLIREISDKAVDKDGVFGKMIVGENGKDRLESIREMVAEDVFEKVKDGQTFGAELVAASVQKIRAHLTKFGIPGRPDQYPVALGLGPGMGLPAEVQSETPIKRVNTAQDGDDDNFVSRAMQKALTALRGWPRG